VRAERESLTGNLGWPVRVGEEGKKERRGEALKGGARARKREKEARLGRADGKTEAADAGRPMWRARESADGSRARPMRSELGLGAGGTGRPMWAG
jgi:hypothetical protein